MTNSHNLIVSRILNVIYVKHEVYLWKLILIIYVNHSGDTGRSLYDSLLKILYRDRA